MSIIIKSGTSATTADVTAAGELKVALAAGAFGSISVSMDPTVAFYDTFEGGTLDTTNRWNNYGSVSPVQAQGNLNLSPATAANATVVVSSQPQIPINTAMILAGLITMETSTALGNHRFWGFGTAPANVGTAAAPLTDAIGFEVDTSGVLRASVYNTGNRVFTTVLTTPTDGYPHFYMMQARGDVVFFYKDNYTVPVAQTYVTAASQLLPMRMASLNSATVTNSSTFQIQGFSILDLSRQATALADGTLPWRKAKVDAYGGQAVTLQGLAGTAASVRPDSYLKVALDPSPLLAETFDNSTLDVTDRWLTGGVAPVSALGSLTVNPATTALAFSLLQSRPIFPLLGNMYNQTLHIVRVDPGLKTGNYRFCGLGFATATPTPAAPVQDGVGFEWDAATGVLSGVVWSGGARLQTVSLATWQPTDGGLHRYAVYYKTSRAYFEIDNVSVASIANPNPNISNLPLLTLSVNGAAAVTPAAVLQATFIGVADSSRNNTLLSDAYFPWRKARVDASGAQLVTAQAPSITTGGPTSITAAATDTLLLTANTARRGAAVTNDSTAALYLSLGTATASTTAYTVKIPANGYYEVPFGYTGQIRGLWSSATGAARLTEVVAP